LEIKEVALKFINRLLPLILVAIIFAAQADLFAGPAKNTGIGKTITAKSGAMTVHRSGRGPLDNQGGPDGFAYRYVDNQGGDTATYGWIELRGDNAATWLNYESNSDDGVLPAPIGFEFPFYGGLYPTVQVSTNGNLQFVADGSGSTEYANECLPVSDMDRPMVCPYWDDLDLDQGGYFPGAAVTVAYRNFGDHFVVEWDSVGLHSEDGTTFKFEAILWTNGRIKLQYNRVVVPETARESTVGIQSRGAGYALNYTCDDSLHAPIENLAVLFYQTQTGTISGHVRDGGGTALYQAAVTINELGVTVRTDANGFYAFPVLAAGNYTLAASRAGYTTVQSGNVAVVAGQTTTTDFSLQWLGMYSYVSLDVPRNIPDGDSVVSVLNVDATYFISDLNVQLSILHSYDEDLRIKLIGPGGQQAFLCDRHGGSGDNFNTTIFDDDATVPIANGTAPFNGSYIPDQPLSIFDDQNVNGQWRLVVYDVSAQDTGIITAWEIQVTAASGVGDPEKPVVATRPALLGNYPNPFNASTEIRFVLPQTSPVTLELYNVLGQSVRTLVNGSMTAGEHTAMWDGRDATGQTATTGVYLLRLTAGGQTTVGKMFLLR
jgi:subtilisin-like proprotein convertase family protein